MHTSPTKAETNGCSRFGKAPIRPVSKGHDWPVGFLLRAGRVQAKLRIGASGDECEQEADHIAERVMRMPEPRPADASAVGAFIQGDRLQRRCTVDTGGADTPQKHRPGQEEVAELRAKSAAAATPPVTDGLSSGVHDLQGKGQPLSTAERDFYEPRFGADFSRVRVHSDSRANRLALGINARAFTFGHDVVFAAGEYAPTASRGRRLVAHELTHVLQQTGGGATTQQNLIQREAGAEDDEDLLDEPAPPPEFGPAINEPGCPATPTRLGNVRPAPDCPDDERELAGRHFKFCIDADVFSTAERRKLREFVRSQPAMTSFTLHGYASVDGGAQYNMRLSCHRAKRAARELMNDGVPSQQIDIAKKGETRRFGAATENRAVLIHTDTPEFRAPDAELDTPQQVVDAAVARILDGQYRLAADAYLSRWTCGRMPNLREMVQRLTINIEHQGRFPQGTRRMGLVSRRGRNEIVLSAETFQTTDPVACAMARIIDMGSHHFIAPTRGVGVHGPGVHPAALFLVELAGLGPCVTPEATDPSDPGLVLTEAEPWWSRRTTDPLANEPPPPCARAPLPGPMGTPPSGASTTAPPSFFVARLDTVSGSGALNLETQRGILRARSPRGAFQFRARVRASGDPAEIARYEVGFLQTIMADETRMEYVGGQTIRLNQPLPIRDGPPRRFAPPPWFEPREVRSFDATDEAEVRLSDSPSRNIPLVFMDPELRGIGVPIERGNALNRASSRILFHTWVAARREDAPLTRFSTFFLDGGVVDWALDVDLVGDRATGSYDANIGPASASTTGMQLSGPTAAETARLGPFAEITGVIPATPRERAGGLPLDRWREQVRRVAAQLEPLRRALGLEHRLMTRIRVDPETGRIELPYVPRSREDLTEAEAAQAIGRFRARGCLDILRVAQGDGSFTVRATCPRPAVTVESRGEGEPSSGPGEEQFAQALFVRLRKELILAPATPDPARVAIPVVLLPLSGRGPRRTGSPNPFAPEHGIGLVALIAERHRRRESRARFAREPHVYDPDFFPEVDVKLRHEEYAYDFRIPGVDIDTVCQDPSLRTDGCVTVRSPPFEPVVRPRYVTQTLGDETIQSPIAIEYLSFPIRFTLYTPREDPGGSTYNHELHHMVVAHRLMQIFKARLARRIRARLMYTRSLAAERPDLARELLSRKTLETMVAQEYAAFETFFGREYHDRQMEVHARESREGSLPPARLPAAWRRPTPSGGDHGIYHRRTER